MADKIILIFDMFSNGVYGLFDFKLNFGKEKSALFS